MNPQPPEYIGNFCAFVFICFVVYYAIKEYLFGTKYSDLDSFVIGYVIDKQPSVQNITITQTTTTKPPKQPKNENPPKNPPSDPPNDPPNDDDTDRKPKPSPSSNKKNVKYNKDKEYKTIFEADQLYFDCIDALYALGVKKNEAKKITKQIFTSSKPNTIQDFLMVALRNNK